MFLTKNFGMEQATQQQHNGAEIHLILVVFNKSRRDPFKIWSVLS